MKNCNLDESYREMVEQALSIGETILERKTKEKENEQEKQQESSEITPEKIETATKGANLLKIKEEAQATRSGIEKEISETQQPTKEEIKVENDQRA